MAPRLRNHLRPHMTATIIAHLRRNRTELNAFALLGETRDRPDATVVDQMTGNRIGTGVRAVSTGAARTGDKSRPGCRD